jgi:hypothetical protein
MAQGLNFVRYQDTPDRLIFILKTIGWLGVVNLGGGAQQEPPGMEALAVSAPSRGADAFGIDGRCEGEIVRVDIYTADDRLPVFRDGAWNLIAHD